MYKALYGDARVMAPTTTSFALDTLGVAGLMYLGALAKVPLPFTPAPLSLQTFVVLTASFLLGRDRAFAGIALFIFLGLTTHITGVAIFAAASGVTYGYLAGFLLTPLVMSRFPKTSVGMMTAMTVASAMILLLGALWLQIFLHITFAQAVLLGVAPFLFGDTLKIALACALVRRMSVR